MFQDEQSVISLGNGTIQNYDSLTLKLLEKEVIENVNQMKTTLHLNLDDDINIVLNDVFSSSDTALPHFNFL